MPLSPLTQRKLANFRANKRGYWSFWIFLLLFFISLFAEFIANDKPIILHYQGAYYFPVIVSYDEKTFGGDFETETDYRDPFIKNKLEQNGWMIWPLIHYDFSTISYDLPG